MINESKTLGIIEELILQNEGDRYDIFHDVKQFIKEYIQDNYETEWVLISDETMPPKGLKVLCAIELESVDRGVYIEQHVCYRMITCGSWIIASMWGGSYGGKIIKWRHLPKP